MSESNALSVEIKINGVWGNFGGHVFTIKAATYLYEMSVKAHGADNVRIVPSAITIVPEEAPADAEVTPEFVREAVSRLLADAAQRAEAWDVEPSTALAVSWRELADAWPALAEAVAAEVGINP